MNDPHSLHEKPSTSETTVVSPASSASSSTSVAAALVAHPNNATANAAIEPSPSTSADPRPPDVSSEVDADGDIDADGDLDEELAPSTSIPDKASLAKSTPSLEKSLPIPTIKKLSNSVPYVGDPTSELPELSGDVFLSSSIDGQVMIWDRRVKAGEKGVRRLGVSNGSAKGSRWCASVCLLPTTISSFDFSDKSVSSSFSPSFSFGRRPGPHQDNKYTSVDAHHQ